MNKDPFHIGVSSARSIPRIAQESMPLSRVNHWSRTVVNDHLYAVSGKTEDIPILLLGLPTGVGKTFIMAELAEVHAGNGHRVLYLGPNHRFFDNLMAMDGRQTDLWLEWLPHQPYHTDNEGEEHPETCRHAVYWNAWVAKGYEPVAFCKHERVCGVQYLRNQCVWHQQRQQKAPIIYGQYAHLHGIPDLEDFSLIIIDEAPFKGIIGDTDTFYRLDEIAPHKKDEKEPWYATLVTLAQRCIAGEELSGKALIDALGGIDAVIKACKSVVKGHSYRKKAEAPTINGIEDVQRLPSNHHKKIAYLLWREATMLQEGAKSETPWEETNQLISIKNRRVYYTFVEPIAKELKNKVIICVDATCNPEMYQAIFPDREIQHHECYTERKGSIFQIYGQATGITRLVTRTKKDGIEDMLPPTEESTDWLDGLVVSGKAKELFSIASKHIEGYQYENPAFISFKALTQGDFFDEKTVRLHFQSQGDNSAKHCDVLFIIGTPMPPRQSIIDTAKAVWFDHDRPFNTTWSYQMQDLTFFEHNQWYKIQVSVGGFWGDRRLNAVLWQERQALLLQAIGRARLVLVGNALRGDHRHRCDVYLFSNIPLNDAHGEPLVKVDYAGTLRDLVGAPQGVQPLVWWEMYSKLVSFAQQTPCRSLTVKDVIKVLGCSDTRARSFCKHLLLDPAAWALTEVLEAGRFVKAVKLIG